MLAALHVYLTSVISMKFLTRERKEGRKMGRKGGRDEGKETGKEKDFQRKLSSQKYSIQETAGLT